MNQEFYSSEDLEKIASARPGELYKMAAKAGLIGKGVGFLDDVVKKFVKKNPNVGETVQKGYESVERGAKHVKDELTLKRVGGVPGIRNLPGGRSIPIVKGRRTLRGLASDNPFSTALISAGLLKD